MRRDRDPGASSFDGTAADRGVSPVIGAVLMLAVALLLMTILQTTAIPALNAQHEFQHNQDVQSDLIRLETTVDRVAATGTSETTLVSLGLRYPPRLFFINPPPASGTLQTSPARPVNISNAVAAGETGDYWNGTTHTFLTTALVYDPAYNEYRAPETVYEPWVVYNRQDGATTALTQVDLVDGRRISLVALDGEYGRSTADTVGVNLVPDSAPIKTVTVQNGTGPITISVPTGLRNDTWARLLSDEFDAAGSPDERYISTMDCRQEPPEPCGVLTLTLEPGTYELRLGEVALGGGERRTPAVYLTDIDGDTTTVPETGRQRLVVEARDQFDNPVSGVMVNATLGADPGSLRAETAITDGDGRATFVYQAPSDVNRTRSITVTAAFGQGDQQRTVTFDVQVIDLTGSASTGGSTSDAGPIVTGVEGSVETRNIGGRNRGREVTFRISATESVTITDFSVTTRNDLEGRPFIDRGTTFDGGGLPVTFSGEIPVALRDIDASADLGVTDFVDPTSDAADIILVLEFADGETHTLALG